MGPTAGRRKLAAELRSRREAAQLTTKQAADVLGCSVQKIGHLERGENVIKKAELAALLDAYGADPEDRPVLEEIRVQAAKRGWWVTYRLPEWAQPLIGLESDASRERTYELELIPGLLQTKDYAHSVYAAGRHLVAPEHVDQQVTARMVRQERLTGDGPLELVAVISEGALRRVVGGPASMAAQLDHLLEISKAPNVKLQVLPFEAGQNGAMSGPVTILTFPDQDSPDIGYIEHSLGGEVIEDPSAVAALTTLFDDLRDHALSSRDSARVIEQVRKEHHAA
jgi:transcriptional regulator with XRE-family HTH domain